MPSRWLKLQFALAFCQFKTGARDGHFNVFDFPTERASSIVDFVSIFHKLFGRRRPAVDIYIFAAQVVCDRKNIPASRRKRFVAVKVRGRDAGDDGVRRMRDPGKVRHIPWPAFAVFDEQNVLVAREFGGKVRVRHTHIFVGRRGRDFFALA